MSTKRSRDGLASLRIEAVVLCDQVRFENTGKAFFIGVYNDIITVPRLPFAMQLWLAVLTRVTEPGNLDFSVSLLDPLNNDLANGLRGEGRYEGEPGRTSWLPIAIPPFSLAAEGEYRIKIEMGDTQRHESFQVRRQIQPQVQIATKPN